MRPQGRGSVPAHPPPWLGLPVLRRDELVRDRLVRQDAGLELGHHDRWLEHQRAVLLLAHQVAAVPTYLAQTCPATAIEPQDRGCEWQPRTAMTPEVTEGCWRRLLGRVEVSRPPAGTCSLHRTRLRGERRRRAHPCWPARPSHQIGRSGPYRRTSALSSTSQSCSRSSGIRIDGSYSLHPSASARRHSVVGLDRQAERYPRLPSRCGDTL